MRDRLQTERLTLRGPELSDGPALAKHFSDFEVVKMTGTIPFPYPPPAADFWIMRTRSKQRRGLSKSYMMELGSGAVIGNVSLFRSSPEDDFEIGYHVGRPWWGQGYVSEACHAVIEEARASGHTRLVAGVYDDNPGSQKIMKKFGFERTVPDNIYCMSRSERVDGHRYELNLAEMAIS